MEQRQMRRSDRLMEDQEARAILEKGDYGVLATISEDQTPYCVGINYVVDGDRIYFHSAPEGHKIDNIQNNPALCLTVVEKVHIKPGQFTADFDSVVAFGSGRILKDIREITIPLTKLCEKYSAGFMDKVPQMIRASAGKVVVIEMVISRLTGKRHV